MLADVDELVHPDDVPGVLLGASADAGDEPVAALEVAEERARPLRHGGVLRPVHDRSECPVHVEEHARDLRPCGEERDRGRRVDHLWRIGTRGAAGSDRDRGGFLQRALRRRGGIVVVPLLLLSGRWQERPAMATSLAAIGIIALAGSISYGIHGDLKPGAAALIGLPAAAGAIAGTTLQQRIGGRTLSLLFALLLAGIGVKLLI